MDIFQRIFRPMSVNRISQLATGNGGLVFTPAVGTHSATVILMHGLGDSADGLQDIPEIWQGSKLKHVKFILPTASQRSVTLNMGQRMNAWYNISQLDDRSHDPNEGIEESSTYIRSLIETEIEKTGISLSRVALAGFSQGGAMSLFTGLQDRYLPEFNDTEVKEQNKRLAGILVMSGYLAKQHAFQLSDTLKETPIYHCHGSQDPVVRPDWAKKTQDGLLEKGVARYDMKTYPGIGHSISMDILRDAEDFLLSVLPADSKFVLKPKDPKTLSVKELKEAIRVNGLSQQAVGFSEKSEFIKVLQEFYAGKGITFDQ